MSVTLERTERKIRPWHWTFQCFSASTECTKTAQNAFSGCTWECTGTTKLTGEKCYAVKVIQSAIQGMCACVWIKMHTCRHPELSSCTHKVQVLQWDSWDFIESPWKQALSLFCLKVALDFLQQLSDSVKRSCTLIWRDGWLGLKIVSIIKYVIRAGMWSQALSVFSPSHFLKNTSRKACGKNRSA